MKSLIRSILKKVWQRKINKKNNLLRKLAKETQNITLLDIGSAGGIEPRWKPIAEELHFIGIEPDQRSSIELIKKCDFKKYQIINSVIWSDKKEISFNLCNKPEVSSVFKPNRKFLDLFPNSQRFEIIKTLDLKSTTLDNELKTIEIDFAKIDIQGGELYALMGMENHLSKCIGLEVEAEFSVVYEGQPLFGDLQKYLQSIGFEFIDFTSLHRWERKQLNNYGQCIFSDGLWMRTPEYIAKHLPHKYLEYILVCSLYGRYDLANEIIEIVKPKLTMSYKKTLNKLIKIQKRTRTYHYYFNLFIKFISGNHELNMHLIY